MILQGKAEAAAQEIIDLFREGTLPEPLATLYIRMDQGRHASTWSMTNQLLVAKRRYRDARTFKQWKKAGRSVRKGEKAFAIFAPITRRIHKPEAEDADENGNVTLCLGYRTIPVFGYEQTDGEEIPELHAEDRFLDELPLLEVARAWGLEVGIYQTIPGQARGCYRPSKAIHLGVKNWRVWAHELMHAADHRCQGKLLPGQTVDQEIVADLGGATLLRCLGYEEEADLGRVLDYIKGYAETAQIPVIQACTNYLSRITAAVELILKTANDLAQEKAA